MKLSWPEPQATLAVVIVFVVSAIVFILLLRPVTLTDTQQGVLLPIIGILVGCLKDVFGYYYNSSSSSRAKDATISTMANVAAETPKPYDPLAKYTIK